MTRITPAGKRIIPFPEVLSVFTEPSSINFLKEFGSFSGPSSTSVSGAEYSSAFSGAGIPASAPYSKKPRPDFLPNRPESTNSFCSIDGAKRGCCS